MGNNKLMFSETINSLDNGMPIVTDECFNYGIVGGCDENCPVYKRGECELQEEVEEMIKKRARKEVEKDD